MRILLPLKHLVNCKQWQNTLECLLKLWAITWNCSCIHSIWMNEQLHNPRKNEKIDIVIGKFMAFTEQSVWSTLASKCCYSCVILHVKSLDYLINGDCKFPDSHCPDYLQLLAAMIIWHLLAPNNRNIHEMQQLCYFCFAQVLPERKHHNQYEENEQGEKQQSKQACGNLKLLLYININHLYIITQVLSRHQNESQAQPSYAHRLPSHEMPVLMQIIMNLQSNLHT